MSGDPDDDDAMRTYVGPGHAAYQERVAARRKLLFDLVVGLLMAVPFILLILAMWARAA